MRPVPTSLAEHLGQPVTTLARAWRLTRADGRVFGFTDHDEALTFSGTRFEAASGLSASAARVELGLSASNREVEGALTSEGISEDDIAAGLFDGARVEEFLLDWSRPDEPMLLQIRTIGEVRRGETGFSAELRGPEADLDRPRGRIYRRRCDAVFGDARCGIDAGAPPFRQEAEILAVEGSAFRVAGHFGAGALVHGRAVPLGEGAGAGGEILGASRIDGTLRLEVEPAFAARLASGARVALVVGCDRSFATCRDRFSNTTNFRGFPHMPGSDSGLSVAKEGDPHDGRPLVP